MRARLCLVSRPVLLAISTPSLFSDPLSSYLLYPSSLFAVTCRTWILLTECRYVFSFNHPQHEYLHYTYISTIHLHVRSALDRAHWRLKFEIPDSDLKVEFQALGLINIRLAFCHLS